MKIRALFLSLLCGFAFTASAAVLNVPSVYATIQIAVNAAGPGDTIVVAPGTYTGTGNFNINISKSVVIAASGGAGSATINVGGSAANPNRYAFGIAGTPGSPISVTIAGFIIENAYYQDGAVVVEDANVTITQCQFITNTALGGGGAISLAPNGSTTTVNVIRSLFGGNTAGNLTNSPGYGGAIEIVPQLNAGLLTVNITNCAFIGNTATADGGAIDIYGASAANPTVTITNSSFSKNNANGFGVSLAAGQMPGTIDSVAAAVTIQNSILYGDLTPEYSTVANPFTVPAGSGSLTISYSDVQGGISGIGATGSNNINADPKYVNPNGDLDLQLSSPAINKANADPAVAPTTDLAGVTRDAQPDMGCFEYVLTVTGVAFTVPAGTAANGTVATFYDFGGDASSLASFTASINWGDGSTTAGTISHPGGSGAAYVVGGSHTYVTTGSYTTTTTVTAFPATGTVVGTATATGTITSNGNNSATHFSVTAPVTAVAGNSFQITVTALSGSNATATSYTGTIFFASSDTSAQKVLPASYTFVPSDAGVHTFSVTLATAGTESITAIDNVTATINGAASVGVSPAAATHFVVSVAGTPAAGTAFSATITAVDAYSNTATGYRGTVHMTTSTTANGSFAPPDYSFTAGDNGVHSFTSGFEINVTGSRSITATDTVTASITGSATFTVAAGPATHFAVSGPAGTVPAGTAKTFVVTATDAYGDAATSYSGTVHFTSSDAQATLPANVTLTNGLANVSVTLKTSGTQTLTATDTVNSSIVGTSVGITVGGAAATHFSVIPSLPSVAGNSTSILVVARDAFENVDTGYSGTVHFTSSDSAATLPANSTLTNGSQTFNATMKTAGTQTVTATDTVSSSITGTTISFTVQPGSATHLSVSTPSPVGNGTPFNATVTALDAGNNVATGYTGTVHVSSTGSLVAPPLDSALTNGVKTFSLGLAPNGTFSVTFTDTVNASINGTMSGIQVINPQPVISSLDVTSAFVNSAGFTLHVSGSSFVTGASVLFNNTSLSVSSVTSTLITATVPASLLTSAQTVNVQVVNPASAIGPSTTVPFAIVASCTYGLGETSANAASGSSAGTVNVIAPSGCTWTAASNSGFLSVTSGTPGSGNGTVGYSVTANTGLLRSGTLTVAGQTFTVTQASGLMELDSAASTGSPTGTATVPLTLSLASGTGVVKSLQFTVVVSSPPGGGGPALTSALSYQSAAGIPTAGSIVKTGFTQIAVSYSAADGASFSGTTHIGDILVPIPASAQQGQTYVVSISAISAADTQGNSVTVGAGTNTQISVIAQYTVSDVFPFTANNAGFFGNTPLDINALDLLEVLRVAAGTETLAVCTDRFDAMDAFPLDTPNTRGGDGQVQVVDLLATLRRASGIDASRPTRTSRGLTCPPPPDVAPMRRIPVHPALAEAMIEFGESRPNSDSNWQTPVYMVARRDTSWSGLALGIEYTLTDDEPQMKYFAGEGSEASLKDESTRGKLALAWLSDITAKSGDRVLLGYVVTTSQPQAGSISVIGVSANAKEDGRAIAVR